MRFLWNPTHMRKFSVSFPSIAMVKLSKQKCTQATLKKTTNSFQYHLSLNAGRKYCRRLQGEHSIIRLTCIKLLFVIKIFVLFVCLTAYDRFYCMLKCNQYFQLILCVSMLRHKAGQEGRGEILLENFFMR